MAYNSTYGIKGDVLVHLDIDADLEYLPHETAKVTVVRSQKIVLGYIAVALAASLLVDWHLTLVVILGTLASLYFIDLLFHLLLVCRSFSRMPEISISKEEISQVPHYSWPTYTIFCPLYKEGKVIPQFIHAMERLDYPPDKLQIMLLLEEDDRETIRNIRAQQLPSQFEIVIVPDSQPKTKPKALNYGLQHARGEMVVIYDAEDVPESDQLKKAVLAFKKSSSRTVCVQAKLNYYNPRQNVLTRLFTAEYSLWFDLVLPGLQSIHAPIPLGGTSNHFHLRDMRKLKGWDAYNVTEDCDLGMRLSKAGYETAIVDSTTYEEANSKMRNWFRQRSRWIKGYMQTYFVHMRNPGAFFKKGARHQLIIFQIIIGLKILSLFINPILWTITLTYFIFRSSTGLFIESLYPNPAFYYTGVFVGIVGNFLQFYYYIMGCAKREYHDLIKYAFFVPFYWLAMSLAGWKALYEIVVKPHYWQKTHHGFHLPYVYIQTTTQKV